MKEITVKIPLYFVKQYLAPHQPIVIKFNYIVVNDIEDDIKVDTEKELALCDQINNRKIMHNPLWIDCQNFSTVLFNKLKSYEHTFQGESYYEIFNSCVVPWILDVISTISDQFNIKVDDIKFYQPYGCNTFASYLKHVEHE